MPNVGITVETCVLTQWCKQKGERVEEGEILFIYETDKSTLEQESPCGGIMLEQFFPEDSDVPVMTNVCVIGEEGESVDEFRPEGGKKAEAAPAAEEKSAPAAAQTVAVAEVQTAAAPAQGFVKASPRAKALASKCGADLRFASGTGPDGRIIERDVRRLVAEGRCSTSAAAGDYNGAAGTGLGGRFSVADIGTAPECDYVDERMTTIRRAIAKQMVTSLQTAAQLTHTISFDATEILAFRKDIKSGKLEGYGNITLNDIILFVVSRTLAKPEHRALNAHLLENDVMRYFNGVHMGVAVDTPRGLIVPTLRNCDKKSLNAISAEAKELADKCRNNTAKPDEITGGTFTVSNLGSFGIEHFTPVINVPQTAILGVNTITTAIKAVDGGIKTYQSMGLSLTYDHRAVDGGPASRFLADLKASLENFRAFLKEQEG